MTDIVVDTEKGADAIATSTPDEGYLVIFGTPTDPSNPKDWPLSKKWMTTIILSSTGFNRIMVSTIIAPALPSIRQELDMSNIESVMAMSVYLLATAFGPLLIGPLSEVYGRKPVLHATNIWFLIWNIVCGFAHNKGTLISARFLAGLGASAIYALAGGVLGDVWRPEQRGRSLGIYQLIPLLAAAVGPILGGYITEYSTWRWMFWSTSILQGFMIILSLILFHETHAPTILQRKAKDLRRDTGIPQYLTEAEAFHKDRSLLWILMMSLSRPIRLLLFHPIIQIQSLLSALNYGLLYLLLSTFSDLWTNGYHEPTATSGLHYLAICLGEVAGALLGGPMMDFVYRYLKNRNEGVGQPEYRMPVLLPGIILAPIGLFLYGWAAQKHAPWIAVDIGIFIYCFAAQINGQVFQAYIIDSYSEHTGSASAASQFPRSLTAFGFPLFAPKMYDVMGYGWGNSMLALTTIVCVIPASVGIWVYGSKLRARAASSY